MVYVLEARANMVWVAMELMVMIFLQQYIQNRVK